MKIEMKLLKDYNGCKTGDIVKVAEDDVQTMLDEGNAEKYVPQITIEKATEQAEDMLKVALETVATQMKLPQFQVVEDENDKSVFESGGEFYHSVKKASTGETTEKMGAYMAKAPAGQNTIIDTEGGFLVPQEFSTQILNKMDESAVLAPMTTSIPINKSIKLPYVQDFDKSASWFGGVTVSWGQEGGTLSASKFKWRQARLELNKVHALVYATDELMDDSAVALEAFISMGAGIALAKEFDDQIIVGSGAGRPRGILNDNAVISVAKETDQANTTFTYNNALAMWKRVSSQNRARWLMNRDVQDEYYKFSQIVGTGGAPNVVVNATQKLPATLFGAPIIWTEHCKTLGTVGDIILTDLSQYLTATKAGGSQIKSATSIHVRFLTDEIAFRFTMRVDGKGWWTSALTPKNGSNTVSPFVTLATRGV